MFYNFHATINVRSLHSILYVNDILDNTSVEKLFIYWINAMNHN